MRPIQTFLDPGPATRSEIMDPGSDGSGSWTKNLDPAHPLFFNIENIQISFYIFQEKSKFHFRLIEINYF